MKQRERLILLPEGLRFSFFTCFPRRFSFITLAFFFLIMWSMCLELYAAAGDELAYSVTIKGEVDSHLRRKLLNASETVELADRPPPTHHQRNEMINRDVTRLRQVLRAWGYYGGNIEFLVDEERSPTEIIFMVEPGERFIVGEVIFEDTRPLPRPPAQLPEPGYFRLEEGRPLTTERLIEATEKLRDWFSGRGYPFPESTIKEVVVNHDEKRAQVRIGFNPGPIAVFGETEIDGLDRLAAEYVQRRLLWREGEIFDRRKMRRTQRSLMEDPLFATVEIRPGQQLTTEGRVPMRVSLSERKPRTIKGGTGYRTDLGAKITLGWSHRNWRGRGDRLAGSLILSEPEQSLRWDYRLPDFTGNTKRTLYLGTGVSLEDTDAYRTRGWSAESHVEQRLSPEISASGGLAYRIFRLTETDGSDELGLLSAPLRLSWDTRDNILDPGKGFKLGLQLAPFIDTFSPDTVFVKARSEASTYFSPLKNDRLVFAVRGEFGTITAESKRKVPLDERFYAGGGGSVRGYAHQAIGPREGGLPTGGLSKLEVGSEVRLRLGRRYGAVLFLDGGQVYQESPPEFEQSLLWGWGIGYRHHTDFGPFRIDLAFPLDYRAEFDDRFQLYLSFGQAF